ncbi:MAG: hypothetical protein ABEK59_08260 [Halobacteria archaeon]
MVLSTIKKLLSPGDGSGEKDEFTAADVKGSVTGRSFSYEGRDEYEYRHYTRAVGDINQLVENEEYSTAAKLLEWCLDYAEAEAREEQKGYGIGVVPPWYYEKLADLRKETDCVESEKEVLERYLETAESLEFKPRKKLVDRLEELEKNQEEV